MGNSWDNKATSTQFTTSVVTNSTSFDVFNTIATTINAFGAANSINMGASGVSFSLGGLTISSSGVTSSDRGTVTQSTSFTTDVTVNKLQGTITTYNGTTTANTGYIFNVNNSTVSSTDVIICTTKNYGGSQNFTAEAFEVSNGAFSIRFYAYGSTTTSVEINFKVFKTA
jgi:hypothetical protein